MSATSLLADPAATATTAATTTAAAGTGALSAVTDAAATATTQTWVDQIADANVKSYVTAKGWKTPGDVAFGYQNLEKLLSGEKIPMPKDEADTAGWDRVYKAIGRPETPEGYKIPAPAAGDKGFADEASKQFHAAGLTTKQGQALAKWYGEFGGKIAQANEQAAQRRNEAELSQYKAEMGTLFDAKLEMGRRAARQFGFTNDELVAFEGQFGTKALLTRFAAIGEALGESVVTGEGKQGFGLTATGAAAQLAELKKDKEFTAKYLSGDVTAKARMAELQAAAAGMTMDTYRAAMVSPVSRV